MVVLPTRRMLFYIFIDVSGAQGVVQLECIHCLRIPPHIRVHYDDPTVVHQLQNEVRRPPALENVVV